MRMPPLPLVILGLAVGPGGCSPAPPDPAADAAVASGPAADPALPRWRLSPEPRVVLGAAQDRDEAASPQFFRIAGAVRLASGQVAVLNGGTAEVLIYGPDGALIGAAGGRGGGPGEFRSPAGIAQLPGDSILVFDPGLRRATVLAADGGLGRVAPLPPDLPRFELAGVLDDGSLVLATPLSRVPGPEPERRPTLLLRFSATGDLIDTIGTFPGLEIYSVRIGDVQALRALPFGADLSAAAAGGRIWVGTGNVPAIELRDRRGHVIDRIEWPAETVLVTAADRARHRDRTLDSVRDPDLRRLRAREFDRGLVRYPAAFPTHARIIASGDGGVWIQEYPRPGAAAQRWHVLGPDGMPVGRVTFEAGLTLLDAGSDYALVRAEDHAGVESVRLHALDR